MRTDEPTARRVLLVEDEAIIAEDLKRRLERLGYQVVGIVDNGADAITLAMEARPSIVFMDIVIQGALDGIDTARELGNTLDVPIVFLTAHTDAVTIQRATQALPYGYLVKPFEERELQTTIEMAHYRHQSEAEARLLLQAMSHTSVGVAIADARDPENRYILTNAAFEQMSGYSAAELREKRPGFLLGPDTDPSTAAEVRRALEERREHQATLVVHRKDGTPFWDELRVSPVKDRAGELTHLVFLHSDITARKQTEAALLQAQKMDAVGQLTGGVAHDFNNILTVILGFAGFVRDDLPEGDPRHDDIIEVLQAAEKAAGLTRQLLTFSRQQPSAKRPLDLNAGVENLLKMLRRSVGQHVFVEFVASARPAVVRMDPVQFDQVLLNLVVNARDAMREGGKVTLTLSHPAEQVGDFAAGRSVRFTVTDTGEGMDRATMARIFEPFFTTKPVGKGTGLGLATCFAIVKDAGGTIGVDSIRGKGTTFTINLPVCDEPAGDIAESVTADLRGAGERVLVVEDDAPLRKAAVRMLEAAGYQVSQAQDGDEAVARLAEPGVAPFELIVSDVVMPHRGGYALLGHVREHAPQTRVLLTSGYLDAREKGSAELDEAPLLWKPYSHATLLRAVRSALGATAHDGAARRASATPGPGRKGRLVLLVEDEPATRSAMQRVLDGAGYEVVPADSLGRAKDALRDGRDYGAILCDLSLADGTGVDLVHWLREHHAALAQRTMVVTGGATDEAGRKLLAEGGVEVLRKPAAPERLLERVASLVKREIPPQTVSASAVDAKPSPPDHLVSEVASAVEAGDALRLQKKLLAACTGADEYLLDVPGTQRSFEAALTGLHMAYQPIVRGLGGSTFGYEALLRSSDRVLSNPLKVLAAAEALGRMEDVGHAVRRAVATTLTRHPERTETIFVNLHPSELRSELLCAATEPLRRSASRIVLAVTERSSLAVGPQLTEEVRLLRAAGYRIAIDDLGEGYAGFALLAHVRPDIAQIDMSLVRDVHRSPLKRDIVASLVSVCRRSGITVLAEGVENVDEAQVLSDLGCDLLQGSFFAEPGPPFPEARNSGLPEGRP